MIVDRQNPDWSSTAHIPTAGVGRPLPLLVPGSDRGSGLHRKASCKGTGVPHATTGSSHELQRRHVTATDRESITASAPGNPIGPARDFRRRRGGPGESVVRDKCRFGLASLFRRETRTRTGRAPVAVRPQPTEASREGNLGCCQIWVKLWRVSSEFLLYGLLICRLKVRFLRGSPSADNDLLAFTTSKIGVGLHFGSIFPGAAPESSRSANDLPRAGDPVSVVRKGGRRLRVPEHRGHVGEGARTPSRPDSSGGQLANGLDRYFNVAQS